MDELPKTQPVKRRMSRWFWLALVLPIAGLDLASLFGGKHHGQPADAQALRVERAGIWLAWSMVGLLVFMALLVGAMVWRFRRLSRNPDPGLTLLDELYQESLADRSGGKRDEERPKDNQADSTREEPSTSSSAAWEKPGDWWQK